MVIVKLSLTTCFPILLNHLLKMLPHVILLLVYPIYLPQFLFLPDLFCNNYTYKKNAEVYDWSRFNRNSFLDDFNITNGNFVTEIEKNDVNISFNNYLSKVDSLIISHVSMKKLSNSKNFSKSPWFTTAMQNSIQKKNKFFKKYIKFQNPVTKNDLLREYKSYRNKLSTIIKESKRKYYSQTYIRQPLLGPLKSGHLGQVVVLQNTFIKQPTNKIWTFLAGF